MTRVLQSDAFIKLPPTDIQHLLQTLQSVPFNAGDTVIRQGGVFGLKLDVPEEMSTANEADTLLGQAAEVLSLVEAEESIAEEDQTADLKAALSGLKAEFIEYDKVVQQMQAAFAEEGQAREALANMLDQLMSLVATTASKK